MIAATLELDLETFSRYAGLSLPRHVSYPMPTWWHDLSEDDVALMYEQSRGQEAPPDLSLYVHFPFCQAGCKFCACTRVVQPKDAAGAAERVGAYLSALEREIVELGKSAGDGRSLRQIHWGGGSPTYLDAEAIGRVHSTIARAFTIAPDAEVAIEIDPRTSPSDKLRGLREIGFNRISMGVQDFNQQVQEHVRRIQPYEMIRDTVATCRELGFDSVNFDLIYGLPYQTVETIEDTLERTIALSPDRVAYYHYAQIPEKIATQRGMDYTELPDSETKLQMFLLGGRLFGSAGYEFIGLDHFAKPDESLAHARRDGTLQRNFQGMTTGGGLDMLAAGSSSIGHLSGIGFLQNRREIEDYVACIARDQTPVHRGKLFTEDDRIRQAVMNQLYCNTEIRPATIEQRFGISFADYFARELKVMEELEGDGLVMIARDGAIRATFPLGRVLLRNVAAVFDAYLEHDAYRVGDQNCFSANA
ncbi:MAG: oxygen-independent coproporphyrinogen III oxidase [Planctomycetota bacterium]|jgi:oxygen-independent coproporphyrinogen-3 oxidase